MSKGDTGPESKGLEASRAGAGTFSSVREDLAVASLATQRYGIAERFGVEVEGVDEDGTSESKLSDKTIDRLRDFVKERATEPGETSEDDTKKTTGKYGVKSKDQIIPADGIVYSYYEYLPGNLNREAGMTNTAELDIQLRGQNVLSMFITSDGILYEDSATHDADDGLVNGILDLIEEKEAAGEITPQED